MQKLFEVIYEDEQLLVINKPAGLVCHPTKTDEYSSLISRVRLYLGPAGHPQLINRLDRETSGVTVIAKEEKAARNLRRLWENRRVQKAYLAIVHGHPSETQQSIVAALGRDETSAVAIKDCVRPDGNSARTDFCLLSTFVRSVPRSGSVFWNPQFDSDPTIAPSEPKPFSSLRVMPQTGRKHQIRIHLAHIGHPIVGDKLYGGDEDLYLALVENRLNIEQMTRLILPYHALHAAEVRFDWDGKTAVFQAEPESWFKAFCSMPVTPD